jgi:hypothetical protein
MAANVRANLKELTASDVQLPSEMGGKARGLLAALETLLGRAAE